MKILLLLICVLSCFSCSSNFSVMTYNVRNGKGLDNNVSLERTSKVIKQSSPDIVMLQELDSITNRYNINVVEKLGKATGMYYTFGGAIKLGHGKYGIGILSKEKPVQIWKIALPGREENRVILFAEFKTCIIACTHLSLTKSDRIASADIIIDEISRMKKPVFIGGDFNDTPDSDLIEKLATTYTILSDSTINTFPANKPDRTIDYIMTNASGNIIKKYSAEVLNEPVVSDHRPIIVKMKLKK